MMDIVSGLGCLAITGEFQQFLQESVKVLR